MPEFAAGRGAYWLQQDRRLAGGNMTVHTNETPFVDFIAALAAAAADNDDDNNDDRMW